MTGRFRGLESEKFDHRFHLRTSNLPKSQSLVLPSEKFQSPRHPIRVASAHDPVALLRESTVAIILAVVGSGRGREQLARQPAASIDDNNYRVTMDDFLIRLLAGASACALGWLSRSPRVCAQRRYRIVCLELSAASVTGSREHARARVRSDQRAQPRIRRYSSGFLSVTCKSISRLDLCYETDVSLVGGGVSTSHGVHIYVELSLTSIYTLRWNALPPFEATFRPPQPSSSFSFASLFLCPCFAVFLFCLACFRRAPLVSGVSLV